MNTVGLRNASCLFCAMFFLMFAAQVRAGEAVAPAANPTAPEVAPESAPPPSANAVLPLSAQAEAPPAAAAALPVAPAPASAEVAVMPSGDPGVLAAVKLWNDFSANLRGGRMREAYACFTRGSRDALTYDAFCARYNPLTAANEMTLSENSQAAWSFSGNKAELKFLAPAGDNGGAVVSVFLAQEDGKWGIVTDTRRDTEEAEADARMLLSRLHELVTKLAQAGAFKNSFRTFRDDCPEMVASNLWQGVERKYFIKAVAGAGTPWRVELYPKNPNEGLRAFRISQDDGAVKSFVPAPKTQG